VRRISESFDPYKVPPVPPPKSSSLITIAEKLRPRILKRRPPLSTLEPPERDSAPVLADPWGPLAEPSTLEGGWPSWFGCWQQNLVHMLYPYQCFGIPQRAGRQHSVGAVEGSVQFRHRSDFWLSLGYPGGRAEGKDNRHYGPARACLALRYCIHRIKLAAFDPIGSFHALPMAIVDFAIDDAQEIVGSRMLEKALSRRE